MAHLLLRAVLAALLVSSFAYALTVDDVARFYLKSGESMVVVPISVSGQTDDLVKINGAPSLVLAPSGSTFQALSAKSDLDPVLTSYLQSAYAAKDFKKTAAMLNQTLPVIEPVLTDCQAGARTFLKLIPTRRVNVGTTTVGLYFLIIRTDTYLNEHNAITLLNQSFPSFDTALDSFIPEANGFGSLVNAGDVDSVLRAANDLSTTAGVLKNSYTNMTSAYQTMNQSHDLNGVLTFSFYENGNAHSCLLNANVTTALSQIQNALSDPSLVPLDQLESSILDFTSQRNSSASVDTSYALRKEQAGAVDFSVSNLTSMFNAAGYSIHLKALENQQTALTTSLDAIKTNGSTTAFDSNLQTFNTMVTQYRSALGPFKTAAISFKNATDNVASAQKKYGDADSRVMALNQQLQGIKSNMSSAIALLSSGDAAKASSQFTALAVQSSSLAQQAGSLPSQGNQLDLPVIGGIVLLVLVLAGMVWYFRKMKKQMPKMGS